VCARCERACRIFFFYRLFERGLGLPLLSACLWLGVPCLLPLIGTSGQPIPLCLSRGVHADQPLTWPSCLLACLPPPSFVYIRVASCRQAGRETRGAEMEAGRQAGRQMKYPFRTSSQDIAVVPDLSQCRIVGPITAGDDGCGVSRPRGEHACRVHAGGQAGRQVVGMDGYPMGLSAGGGRWEGRVGSGRCWRQSAHTCLGLDDADVDVVKGFDDGLDSV